MSRLTALFVLLLLGGVVQAGDFEEEVVCGGRTLRDVLHDLGSSDRAVRLRASRVLRLVGPEADEAVPALLMALKNEDMTVRNRLTWALARMAAKKVPILAAFLALEEERISYGIARSLALLGPEARPAARALRRQLASPTARTRALCAMALYQVERRPEAVEALRKETKRGTSLDLQWAAWSLEQCGPGAAPAATDLVALLGHSDDLVRRFTFRALEAIGRPAVPALLQGLESPKVGLRVESAEALGKLGPEAEEAVGKLIARLADSSPGPRASAARALGRIGLGDDRVLAALRKGARDADRDVRLASARALAALGPDAAPAVPELIQGVRDSSREVRHAAGAALGRIGKPAVPALVKLLDDEDVLVRRQAIGALQEVGPDAGDALAALQKIARDSKEPLRLRAVAALGALGKPAAPALAELLTDRDARDDAVQALAHLGPDAAAARPALEKALGDGTPAFRHKVIAALGGLGPAGREAIPALVRAFDAEVPPGKARVLLALVRLQAPAKEVIPVFRKALKENDDSARLAVRIFLLGQGADARPVVDDLVGLLQDGDDKVRLAAAGGLALLGESKAVLPVVKALLKDDSAERRRTGLDLLPLLGPSAKDFKDEAASRLKDDNSDVRLAAAAALLEIDPADRDAIAALAGLAKDQAKRGDRPAVFRLLARAGAAARPAVPVLTALVVKETDLGVRLEAARTLGAIGPDAREAVPALFGLLLDLERLVDVRSEEIDDLDTLKALGAAPLRRSDGLDDDDLWRQAERAIATLRSTRDVSAFSAVLRSARRLHQGDVLRALAGIGPAAAGRAEKDLGDDLAERRLLAARVLAVLGPRAKESAAGLRKALGDGNRAVAVEAARALHAVSGDTAAVLPVLQRELTAPGNTAVRAARGLAGLGTAARPAGEALLTALSARDDDLRREAARALGACKPEMKQVVPALQRRLRDPSWSVRVTAALALAKLDSEYDPVPLLVRAVRYGDTLARLEAAAALGRLGERGRPGLTALAARLEDANSTARAAAAAAVVRLDGSNERAMTTLLVLAVSPGVRPEVRLSALEALAGVKVVPRRCFYTITTLAHDRAGPHEVRQAAKAVLAKWR